MTGSDVSILVVISCLFVCIVFMYHPLCTIAPAKSIVVLALGLKSG